MRIEVARALPSRAAFARLVRIEADASDERASRASGGFSTTSVPVAVRLYCVNASSVDSVTRRLNAGRLPGEDDASVRLILATQSRPTFPQRVDAWLIHHEALGTWLAGIATGVLAMGVVVAWFALRDARATRHAQLIADLSRRFDEEERRESLRFFDWYTESEAQALVRRLYGGKVQTTQQNADDTEDWLRLCINLNYLEALGVLVRKKLIDAETIYLLWGPTIMYTWERWQATITTLRIASQTPQSFWHLQFLATQMRDVDRRREKLQPQLEEREVRVLEAEAPPESESPSGEAAVAARDERPRTLLPDNSLQRALRGLIVGLAFLICLHRRSHLRRR